MAEPGAILHLPARNSRTAAMFNFNSRELKASAVGRKIYVTSYCHWGLSAVQIYSVFYNLQHVNMSCEEENSSNSNESSFPSQADYLESFNSQSSGEENYLIGLQPYQIFEPEYSTDEERGDGEDADEQQHEQDDRMGNHLDW